MISIKEKADDLAEEETEDLILGLGLCNDSTDSSFLNELLSKELKKVNPTSSHLLNLIKIVSQITHTGAFLKGDVLLFAINELSTLSENKKLTLKKFDLVDLVFATARLQFRTDISLEVSAKFSAMITGLFTTCQQEEGKDPFDFCMKTYMLLRNHQLITPKALDVVQNSLIKSYPTPVEEKGPQNRLRWLILFTDVFTRPHHDKPIENDLMIANSKAVSEDLVLEKKHKWLVLQSFILEVMTHQNYPHILNEIPPSVRSLYLNLEKQIEEAITNQENLLKYQNYTAILILHLFEIKNSDWISKISSSLSKLDQKGLNMMVRKIINNSISLVYHYPHLVKSQENITVGILSMCSLLPDSAFEDVGILTKIFEYICTSREQDLFTHQGEIHEVLLSIFRRVSFLSPSFLSKVAGAMTINDVRRLAFRCSSLETEDTTFVKQISAFKIASLIERDLDLAMLLNSFELLHHYDEYWCKEFLYYPETAKFIKMIGAQLKAGKIQSGNSLVKVIKLLIFLGKDAKTQSEISEYQEQSLKIQAILERKTTKETIKVMMIERSFILDLLSSAKNLAFKHVYGSAATSNTQNVVLSSNLLGILFEYHLCIEPLSTSESATYIENIKVVNSYAALPSVFESQTVHVLYFKTHEEQNVDHLRRYSEPVFFYHQDKCLSF